MKKVAYCLCPVLIIFGFCSFLPSKASHVFTPSFEIANSNYQLTIIQANIPPLRDTGFGGNKCFITSCPLTLTNNTNDTLKYAGMSASWWEYYSIDNKNFTLASDYWNVFKNGPVVFVLPPHQFKTRNIEIITNKDYFRGEKIRIAMRIQKVVKLPIVGEVRRIESESNFLIWSNEIIVH